MHQYDIRLIDTYDPGTAAAILKEIKKATTDAGDKYETFVITHEPINLKAKLALKKRSCVTQPQRPADDEDEELIVDEYTDQDDDGIDL